MVKSIFISDLYGKELNKEYFFDKKINIVTGINGAGKTTFIKLVWYLISGNIERALEEIEFSYVRLIHELFVLEITRDKSNKTNKYITIIEFKNTEESKCLKLETEQCTGTRTFEGSYNKINEMNLTVIKSSKYSLFFPTFRRIEGGFSIERHFPSSVLGKKVNWDSVGFKDLVESIGKDLTVYNHKLIASVSTNDIEELMKNEYLRISKKSLELNNEAMDKIKNIVTQNSQSTEDISRENINEKNRLFNSISSVISNVDKEQKEIEKPIDELGDFIKTLYNHKGIQFSDKITIGDTNEALSSNKLSAGEKQMLSFLCYNAFISNAVIFIDEPELSLHVDWQRILIKTMIKQNTTNQLIFATHSPFIYSQYEKNEIILDENRGDNNGKSNSNI